MMVIITRETHWSFVPRILGILLVAAGAADGHDLVVSGRDADWPLLIRADLELLGGFWLLSGRSPCGTRIAAIITFVSLLAYDVARMQAGYPARHVVGQIATSTWWVFLSDLLILAGLLRWRTGPAHAARIVSHPGRFAAASFIAAALGVAIDRSQVGQFPIIATVRAGRSTSGLDYLVYLPDGYYRSFARWPVILTLHGRGEAGLDIGLVRRQGLPLRIEKKGGLPFVIVAPLSSDWAWNVEALDALLDEVLKRYRVDLDRVYVTGNSMGGNGTWALAAKCPERFAAIVPICGVGDASSTGRLKNVPTWAFHGADDRVVPPEKSERMIAALKKAGGDAKLTVYPGVGHDAWTATYANPRFYEWLLQHNRSSPSPRRRYASHVRTGVVSGGEGEPPCEPSAYAGSDEASPSQD
jgi:dienelactone hydrolase